MARDLGKELPRNVSRSNAGISRRQALKLGMKAGVLALAGKQAYDIEQAADRRVRTGVSAIENFFRPKEDQGGVTVEVHQESGLVSAEFKAVFAKLTDVEKAQALQEVRRAKSVMLTNLDNEVIERIAKREDLIRSSGKKLGMNDEVANLLVGLVITESNGTADAVGAPDVQTGQQAKGLTQIMEDIANKYGLRVSDDETDERFIPEKILPVTAQELLEYYAKFGDWGLAFWSWHVGEPRVYETVKTYLAEQFNRQLPDINVAPADDSPEAQAEATAQADRRISEYREAIKEHKVTVYHLFAHPSIREKFKDEAWDKTDQYVYRVVAAFESYDSEKRKLGL